MKVIKPQKISLLHRTFERDGECRFTVTSFLFFRYQPAGTLLTEMALWQFAAGELPPEIVLDVGMPKSRAELLLNARAYPASGRPAPGCRVRAQLGAIDKSLVVVGDRYWRFAEGPTEAESFTQLPINHARAFGGEGFAQNPVGKGAVPIELNGVKVHPLPNIEYPDLMIRSPGDRPSPAGFGPLDQMWPQRFRWAGTYDARWLQTRYPDFPDDLDWRFFNTAPEDQQSGTWFRGDETFVLENLHPTGSTLRGALPGVCVRSFVVRREEGPPRLEELETRLDTVWLFPHAEYGLLVFRADAHVEEDDAEDVATLLLACENLGLAKPIEHYQTVLQQRLDRKKAHLYVLRDSDLLPAPGERPEASPPNEEQDPIFEVVKQENLLKRNLRRRAEVEQARVRKQLEAQGMDPDDFVKPLPEEVPIPDDPEKIARLIEDAQAKLEVKQAQAQVARAKSHFELREIEKHFPSEPSDRKRLPAPEIDPQLAALCRQGADRKEEARRKFPHMFPSSAGPGPERGRELRQELEARFQAGKPLSDLDLSGVDLSNIALQGANLSGLLMENADLTGADLCGADLRRAVLTRANLSDAKLCDADLEGANLGEALLVGTSLKRAKLRDVVLQKATLNGTCLEGATLHKVNLIEASLEAIELSASRATGLIFMESDLSGTRFVGAHLEGCVFLNVNLDGADFTASHLNKTVLLGGSARKSHFDRAQTTKFCAVNGTDLTEATFLGANLDGGNLRAAILTRADFTGASLQATDLSESHLEGAVLERVNAREARFVRTGLSGATFKDANLLSAVMQKADLTGTRLEHANLFRADLVKARVERKDLIRQGKPPAGATLQAQETGGKMRPDELNDRIKNGEFICDVTLAGKDLGGQELGGAVFERVDFSGASLKDVRIRESFFVDCSFVAADLSGGQISQTMFERCDLSAACLAGTRLVSVKLLTCRVADADFANADLIICVMSDSDLSRARMRGVVMDRSVFLEGQFEDVDLSGARLKQTTLANSDLRTATLDRAEFSLCVLVGSNLSSRDLRGAKLPMTQFTDANLSHCILSGANLEQCNFKGADLSGSDLSKVQAANALFIEARARGADFRGANLCQSLLIDADLSQANLSGAALRQCNLTRSQCEGARFVGTDLTHSDFSHARLKRADFSDATLYRTRFHRTEEDHTRFTDRSTALGNDELLAEAEDWSRTKEPGNSV